MYRYKKNYDGKKKKMNTEKKYERKVLGLLSADLYTYKLDPRNKNGKMLLN